jgi:hypothetical protein
MEIGPRFPLAAASAGMYESFYLRAFAPREPLGVWIRYTVRKPSDEPPIGSLWCVVFDARHGAPFMHKLSSERLAVPEGGWIEIDEQARMGPSSASGSCGPASWSLRFSGRADELRHLSPSWLYRTPLPRTKLTSPLPVARFDGELTLVGREPLELDGWTGMVGHNWGAEHAERWIWLHGCAFEEDPDAWVDVGFGRLMIAGRLTPWTASGCIALGGKRHRLGGLLRRGLQVSEGVDGAGMTLRGAGGLEVRAQASVPPGSAAGWSYSDPDGRLHDVVNCSVAELRLDVRRAGGTPATLWTAHGGAYELGMRERDHGVPIAPFPDGPASEA